MSDIRINGGTGPLAPGPKTGKGAEEAGFGNAMQEALGRVGKINDEAEKAISELASGGDITKAVIAMEKADISFQLMVEVRNKLISAYEDIMRMQV